MRTENSLRLVSILLVTTALVMVGCGDTQEEQLNKVAGGSATLVTILPVSPGAQCAGGGVQVDTGIDDNRDGVLDASEVESSEVTCNGTNGASSNFKVVVTPLSVGDANCPFGGQRVDSGLDANGNRALETNEITATAFDCDPEPLVLTPEPSRVKPMAQPTAPAPQFTIEASGGGSSTGFGGAGGEINVTLNGSEGGHIKLFKNGLANADWIFPAALTYNLGTGPLNVTTGTVTVSQHPWGNDSLVAQGEYHTHSGSSTLYRREITATDSVITGIMVSPGATLILGSPISIPNDLVNQGNISATFMADGISRNDISIVANAYQGLAGSMIMNSGADNNAGVGGNAGRVQIQLRSGFFNQGDIGANGGSSTFSNAGVGGEIVITSKPIMNTGAISALGGQSTAALGGQGGYGAFISLQSYSGLYNSGNISITAGSGTENGGDNAFNGEKGGIFLGAARGELKNTGNLTANGGNGVSGTGGNGGHIFMSGTNGGSFNTGNIASMGGTSASLAGGRGGTINLNNSAVDISNMILPSGDIVISGNIDIRGGTGATVGGTGGILRINNGGGGYSEQAEVILLGYSSILSDGGNAPTAGQGGFIDIYQTPGMDVKYSIYSAGAILNHIPLYARGGTGTSGGRGGNVTFEVGGYYSYSTGTADYEVIHNYADIHLEGGGGDAGGNGGCVGMTAQFYLLNVGNLYLQGGAGTTGNPGGVCGGFLASAMEAKNQGAINAYGGSSQNWGANGGNVLIYAGTLATNTGAINLNGGNATDIVSGAGGSGGKFNMVGITGGQVSTGTVTVDPGTGATSNGTAGSIVLGELVY